LRKLAILAPVCAFLFFAQFAFAQFSSDQQADFFIGGGTLLSSSSNSSGLPAEKGGTYLNLGGDVVFFQHHLGINVETAWRAAQGSYLAQEINYRPILTDFNLLYQPHLTKKVGLDLMAGIGADSTRFYAPGPSQPGVANYESTDHFMEHLGGGIRYYVWHRNLFVRPEVHYYHIQNNSNSLSDTGFNFNSNNVVRVGASVGFTLGGGS
jgi:outer membrane protein with beta-barrel domain